MSTMASSPNGLNSARFCCGPVDGGARREVPVGAGGARARFDRDVVAVGRARATRPPGRPRPRRPPRVRASPGCRRPRTRASSPGASRSCSDVGAASPPGITVIVTSTPVLVEAGDDHGLVGATVGLRRAFRAVPRARHDVGRRHADAAARRRPPTRSDSASTTSSRPAARRPRPPRPRSPRAGSASAGPCGCDGAAAGSGSPRDRSHPLPPERVLVEDVGQRVVAIATRSRR